ncbi:DUF2894 domain-containing protein [Pseudoxanthomonas sp.]|uniref:DUF2894 domain-containing protein n=1 Tax=Pseudoxanthomonas sp. TaxID=1871049 RepID=UPI00262206A0|nr:DUF2894 domain-containing protein [Pseudoxanthomonas sp.]WDS37769.1 MAG: DUF2894 domain-containing protein [Pseudoxanthomonas sp.]
MRADACTARTTLEAWRVQGADRLDPLRFHFMDALERRAAGHAGDVRRQLDDRLSGLLQAYADDLASAPGHATDIADAATREFPARGPLAELLDRLSGDAAMLGNAVTSISATPQPAAFPELPALESFRSTWSKIRSDSQLRQSLQQLPEDAGPLNSGVLVHRAIALMRDVAPGYLQHFLSYVDSLSGLEQLQQLGALPVQEAPMTEAAAKRARRKPRKPRG